MFKQTDDRTTKAPGVTPKLKANLLVKDSEPTRRVNLSPDHLRFEFYVRYFGVEEALRMTSDDQGLAIARALIEKEKDLGLSVPVLADGHAIRHYSEAQESTKHSTESGSCKMPATPAADKPFLAPVQHACESQTQSRKAGEPGRNLKDWKSFL